MLKPREPRFQSDLAVTVVGQDINGNPFKQTARVENISRRGGRLAEIRCLSGPGELIQIRHRGRKEIFRVVWVDVPSGQVGICCVEDSALWGERLPHAPLRPASAAKPAPASPPAPSIGTQGAMRNAGFLSSGRQERRFPRYRCSGGVSVSVSGMKSRLWGQLTAIGLGGCYIETLSPFPHGTMLELLVGAYGLEVRLSGEVRCSHPRQGMGIMFTHMDERQSAEVERLVAAAAGRSPGRR